jgi:YVTN family beta-propeller protein
MIFRSYQALALFLVLSTVFVAGCDLFGSDDENQLPSLSDTRVVIGNGGVFSAQDGSLTVYNPEDSTSFTDDINAAFIHLIKEIDGRLYVVDNTASNNAGRITVYDANSREEIGQIQNVRPPRDIAFVSETKAYVPNLSRFNPDFSAQPSTVSIVNPATEAFVDTLAVGRNPEGVVVTTGRAFVANSGDRTLSVIDTETDTVEETVNVCGSPNEVFVDNDGEVVVVCESSPAEVVFLNAETLQVAGRIELPGAAGSVNGSQSAFYSELAERLFVINGSTFDDEADSYYEVDTATNGFLRERDLPASNQFVGISAVAYDDVSQSLYLARLPVNADGGADFTSAGATFVLHRGDTVADTIRVGVSPSHIEVIRGAE